MFEHPPDRVIHPAAVDLEFVPQDAFFDEAQLAGDPLRGLIANGNPQHDAMEIERLEAKTHQGCCRFGAHTPAGIAASDPVADFSGSKGLGHVPDGDIAEMSARIIVWPDGVVECLAFPPGSTCLSDESDGVSSSVGKVSPRQPLVQVDDRFSDSFEQGLRVPTTEGPHFESVSREIRRRRFHDEASYLR